MAKTKSVGGGKKNLPVQTYYKTFFPNREEDQWQHGVAVCGEYKGEDIRIAVKCRIGKYSYSSPPPEPCKENTPHLRRCLATRLREIRNEIKEEK